MKSSDELLREFVAIRARRDALRRERSGLFCERAEPVSPVDMADAASEAKGDPLATFVFPEPTQEEACWKAARKWDADSYKSRFYLDPPPSKWCATCQRRQVVSDAYRVAVRAHAGALRGLLARGRALDAVARGSASQVDPPTRVLDSVS